MSLTLAFDLGHSSIGWAVLRQEPTVMPELLGCGTVLFEKNSALAIERRRNRSQRRHVRATRRRIQRIEKLLEQRGALTSAAIAAAHQPGAGDAAPWLLAARVLASDGVRVLSWPELWHVLRWYAHNRGYESMGRAADDPDADENHEKVQNARDAMGELGAGSMAETICRHLGQDPLGPHRIADAHVKNYLQANFAFPREVVLSEVERILHAHRGHLPGLDEGFIRALLHDARALRIPGVCLAKRYQRGLLFGRLAMRYDNRIIGRCAFQQLALEKIFIAEGMTAEAARAKAEKLSKLPAKRSPEFLRYRWAMMLVRIQVAPSIDARVPLRPLSLEQRQALHQEMSARGRFTKGAFKQAVRALPGVARDNLDQVLVHPDAEKELVLDPVQALVTQERSSLAAIWPTLPSMLQSRLRNRWWRPAANECGVSLVEIREQLVALGGNPTDFDAAFERVITRPRMKRFKGAAVSREEILGEKHRANLSGLTGRAPYARPLLQRAFEIVVNEGADPKAKGQILEETPDVRKLRDSRPLDRQTNNHLVRHRLLIFGRLIRDLVAHPDYANGEASRVETVVLEVARELREWAGKNVKEIDAELRERTKDHTAVVKLLEARLPTGTSRLEVARLIRKARVAQDLKWTCPYTGESFEPQDLLDRRVDLDHVIPRSQRPSDGLDSLVLTFAEVNKWKGSRTALAFIQECGGQSVPALGRLSIMTPQRYREFVESLDTKGHRDDQNRKRRRREFLLLERYEDEQREFLPGQLTQTSQLNKLGRLVVQRELPHVRDADIVFMRGQVTAAVRRAWRVTGCLAAANVDVLDPKTGDPLPKAEIREITHLHHALDACVLAFAGTLLPDRNDLWLAMRERRMTPEQQRSARANGLFEFNGEGSWRLVDLPNDLKDQIRRRLAERRVVQHVPADMGGLRVEANTRRVLQIDEGRALLQQRAARNGDGSRPPPKQTKEAVVKLFGVSDGKLAALKGVRVITDNFGVAVLEEPGGPRRDRFVIIPHHRVWKRLPELRRLNGGKPPQIIRNGQMIALKRGAPARLGHWRVFSIKNNARGLALDLGRPDAVSASWNNVLLASLLRDGASLVQGNLAG